MISLLIVNTYKWVLKKGFDNWKIKFYKKQRKKAI